MGRSDIEANVASHYTRGDLTGRILTTLGLQAEPPGTVLIDALFPVDQLHHGGVGLTEQMASAAGVTSGMRVLDAGSGIGGPARFLADRFKCRVDAVDLSDAFVRTAEELDRIVGLDGRIRHRTGSVLDLPFDPESFDVVWSQNVTMNVAEKDRMFSEAIRVLRPGGVFVLTHVGMGRGETIDYPVPWAMTEATSFVTPPSEMIRALSDAGFQDIEDHAQDAPPSPPPPQPPGQPDDSIAMGDDMPERRANSSRAVADGRLVPMLVTANRA